MRTVRQRPGRRLGVSVATVLLFLSVLLTVLITALSVGTYNLRLAVAHDARAQATNLAEAAITEAIGKLAESDFTFGQDITDVVEVNRVDGLPGTGLITFDPNQTGHSVNNFANAASQPDGAGGVVPARTVRLVGHGKVGQTERWVECMVGRPPFPDPLIASGGLLANQLEVGAVRERADYTGGSVATLAPERKLSGSLFANSAEQGVHLVSDCQISGNIESPGPVVVDPGNQVFGVIRTPGAARPLPHIDVATRIQNLSPNSLPLENGTVAGNLVVEPHWFSKREGSLEVSGDLVLEGSVLSVTGPLTVTGCLRGHGAILVDGPVLLGGGSELASNQQLALAATGDIEMSGEDRDTHYFEGLLYTQSDLKAERITVVGVVASDGPPGLGNIELNSARVVHVPVESGVRIGTPWVHFSTWGDRAIQIMISVREVDGVKRFDLSSQYVMSSHIVDNRISDISQWQLESSYGTASRLDLTEAQACNILRQVNIGGLWPWNNVAIKNQHFAFVNHIEEILAGGSGQEACFDLNRLLPDAADSPRVLSWRPLTGP